MAVDIVDGLHIGVAALVHDGLHIPTKVKAEGDVGVAQAMYAHFRESVLSAHTVDLPPQGIWIARNQFAHFAANYIIEPGDDYIDRAGRCDVLVGILIDKLVV